MLNRAIASVRDQLPTGGSIVVVANGSRCDSDVVNALASIPAVRVLRVSEANVAAAQRWGRNSVMTEFFSFLDDDDEYLPGAIALRLAELRDDPSQDVVVTNGMKHDGHGDTPTVRDPAAAARDPLRALLRENWLASCAATFRSSTVGMDFFPGITRHFEWTLLAYRLALTKRIRFVDVPTYRLHTTEASASKSTAFVAAMPEILSAVLALRLPRDVRDGVAAKLAYAEHSLAAHHLELGHRKDAWRHHLRSLRARRGMRFLGFTRRLLHARSRRRSCS
jgi:glycosyltransferase involved in cell wall biosynthesis